MRSAIKILLALVLVIGAAGAPAPAGKKEKAKEPDKPEILLKVTPRFGFRPLTITLSGTLIGVDPGDAEFCHPGVEWESRTPEGLVTRSVEDPRCLHPPEEVRVETGYTKIVTLSRPGTYEYRLILHRRDGGRLQSNTQEVRVLDNR